MNVAEDCLVVLTTLNARYHHSAFGLRYIYANMGSLQVGTRLLEFTTKKNPTEAAREILSFSPKIVGLGIYIWNRDESLALIRALKAQSPSLHIVAGGPEVSHETETQPFLGLVDCIICGEADVLFREHCEQVLSRVIEGRSTIPKADENFEISPLTAVMRGPLPDLKKLQSPYAFYTDEDIKNRVIYVEASRGCPYKCEYCLSSLDEKVRDFDVELFLAEMQRLIERGARTFKFVDRTFNLSISKSQKILEFFLAHVDLGLFLHFEMVPDRLPQELRSLIARFPKGALQFEIGVQTMNSVVAHRISRRQNYDRMQENFRFLRDETGVHTHADLIFGLPGESWESFREGFDRLHSWGPDEVQVGMLKRLKGTPIVRHDKDFSVQWSEKPPYEIVSNRDLSSAQIQELKIFADVWDLYWNSGRFKNFLQRLSIEGSLFDWVHGLSRAFIDRFQRTHGVRLEEQFCLLLDYVSNLNALGELGSSESNLLPVLKSALILDYLQDGRTGLPDFLKIPPAEFKRLLENRAMALRSSSTTPKRQERHLREPQPKTGPLVN